MGSFWPKALGSFGRFLLSKVDIVATAHQLLWKESSWGLSHTFGNSSHHSPIFELQRAVKHQCCAILCDSVLLPVVLVVFPICPARVRSRSRAIAVWKQRRILTRENIHDGSGYQDRNYWRRRSRTVLRLQAA